MGRLKIRHLIARPQKRRVLWYWQPAAKLRAAGFLPRRLPDDPLEAARAAEALNAQLDAWYNGAGPAPKHRPDSLQALNILFQRDDSFRAMSPRTQTDYLYGIKAALEWTDGTAVAALDRRMVRDWYRVQRDERGPSTARNRLAALRRLLSFGKDEGWLAENPALNMRVTTPSSRSRVWSIQERDAMVAAAIAAGRRSVALGVMLGWCLGQRPADLRTLTWAAYDGQAVALRQRKTGTQIWVPALPELRTLLDASPRTAPCMVISEATDQPYAESAFQHTFARIRSAAGLPADLQFRDLRRTLATALGAAGCTDDQIRSVTGHQTRSVVAVYVRPDRTYASAAMERLQDAQNPATLRGRKPRGVGRVARKQLEG